MTSGTSDHRPIEVRTATPSEYPRVGRLVERAYRDGGEIGGSDDYGQVLRDVAGRARESVVLVAVRDGRVVGSVTVIPAGSRDSEIAREGELEFRFLAVERAAWGTGAADALVQAVIDRARAEGVDTTLCIRVGNDAAVRLYARHGFTRLPDRDWSPRPDVRLLGMVLRTARVGGPVSELTT